jgi:hypothetical protein
MGITDSRKANEIRGCAAQAYAIHLDSATPTASAVAQHEPLSV